MMSELSSIYLLDLLGVFAFALSGALSGIEKRYDLFGLAVVAFLTALGGGTVRDLLLGNTPVGWMLYPEYMLVALLAVPAAVLFRKYIGRLRKTLFLFDSIGIGVFTIIGIETALARGLSPVVSVLMGTLTAVFGGVLRDIFNNEIPLILRKEIYATVCIFGGALFFILQYLGLAPMLIEFITIVSVIALRLIVVKYRLSLPVIR